MCRSLKPPPNNMTADKRQPWMKWYARDWRGDGALRMVSFAARGLWADLLSVIHDEGRPYGHLLINGNPPTSEQLARMIGGGHREIDRLVGELEAARVFDRGGQGEIVSRRMVRDKAKADHDRALGKRGGNPNLLQPDNGGVNPRDNGMDKAQIPETRSQKEPPIAPRKRGALSAEQLAEFDEWYSSYPHKVSRGAAERAWPAARALADLAALKAGLAAYVRAKPPDVPWRNPATWLNGKGWLDAPAEVKPNGHDPADADRARFSALLRGYKPGGNWPEVALGPRPESGQNHRIPQDLLAEWREAVKRPPQLPQPPPNATGGQNTGNGGLSGGRP